MATQVKINDIGFDIEVIAQIKDIKEFKKMGALDHLPEAEANAIYDEVWKQAGEFKPKEPVLHVVKPRKTR